MSKFEDHLWREFVREHGNALAQMSTPTAKHPSGAGRGWSPAPASASPGLVRRWRSCSARRPPRRRSR